MISNISTKLTLADMLRYGLAYLCLIALILPAGWVMLQILSDLSFIWIITGGSRRLHHVGYYFLATVIAVLWVSGAIFAESWFRVSIDEIRLRRLRAELGSPERAEELPKNKLMRSLRSRGLDILSRRVFIATCFLLFLLALKVLSQQVAFYAIAQAGP